MAMHVTLTPEQERLIQSQLRAGLYNTVEQVIGEALEALRQRDQGLHDSGDSERQQEAVRSMLEFAEKDRVRLENITVKELIREGRRV